MEETEPTARHTGAGIARRAAFHERMRQERVSCTKKREMEIADLDLTFYDSHQSCKSTVGSFSCGRAFGQSSSALEKKHASGRAALQLCPQN